MTAFLIIVSVGLAFFIGYRVGIETNKINDAESFFSYLENLR